jgi:DNA-directed RNA polymerase I and III subunit RPAC1
MGVFDIEDLGKNKQRARVADPRKCSTCRECKRQEKFADRVYLEKVKDKFEFTVESVGIYKPEDIVMEAISVLKEKSHKWIDVLKEQTGQT